jgi:hypothetical protein
MPTVTVIDETTAGRAPAGWAMHLVEEQMTLRELIRRRVHQEVSECNALAGSDRTFAGLVQPGGSQATRAGYRLMAGRRVDAQVQFQRAVEAFERNGFVVLVGGRQVEDLDAEIMLSTGTEVTFLRLVSLVGG